MRNRIEQLKAKEKELEAELDMDLQSEEALKVERREHRHFKFGLLIALGKVDPEKVKDEEERQIAGGVSKEEMAAAVEVSR